MIFETLLPFIIASIVLTLTPGPDILFVSSQSLLHGKRAGIMITSGLCTGLILQTLAVALGIAALIQTSPIAFNFIKYLGAAYILYLAWRAFSFEPDVLNTRRDKSISVSSFALYRRGIIMNISNPKVSIFFLAFLPQFADADHGSITVQILLLGAIFTLISLFIFTGVSIITENIAQHWQRSEKTQKSLYRLSACIYVCLALNLLFVEIQ